MVPFTVRYDESLHHKLKIIAAYKKQSLNALLLDISNQEVKAWERKHGGIELVDTQSEV